MISISAIVLDLACGALVALTYVFFSFSHPSAASSLLPPLPRSHATPWRRPRSRPVLRARGRFCPGPATQANLSRSRAVWVQMGSTRCCIIRCESLFFLFFVLVLSLSFFISFFFLFLFFFSTIPVLFAFTSLLFYFFYFFFSCL